MATKERILALLRGTEAGRIRFTVATTDGLVTVNRAVFETVATAIQTGKIKVTPQAVFSPGVGAEYHTGAVPGGPSGELLIPPLFGREQEGMAMHELTHAFFDLKSTNITATEEEAVCYVVDALYFRMTGSTPAGSAMNRTRLPEPWRTNCCVNTRLVPCASPRSMYRMARSRARRRRT